MINSIILYAFFGIFILISFTIGLYFGCKIKNNEKIEFKNPIDAFKEHKEVVKEAKKINEEQKILEQNLANINAYDGTDYGQKDFKK